MPGPLLGKDSLVALLDVVSILWRILEDFEVLVPYPYSKSFLSNNYGNSCRVLSVRIPCGIPSSLFHIPFPQFQFIHPPPPLDKKMVEFSNDFKVEETSISANSIHHEKIETTSDGTYVVVTKPQSESTDTSSSSEEVKVLQTTKDGKIALIPQPSDDPADPLNWSWSKKHQILVALTFSALLTDWGMTWGTTLFEAQAQTWGMSVVDISNSLSGGIFLQGPGGVLVVPLVQRYGRLVPVINVLNNANISF